MDKLTNKVFLFTFFILLFGQSAFSQSAFISTWKTDNPGTSNDDQLTIPGTGTYTVAWEEIGNSSNIGSITGIGNITLTLPAIGTYRLEITGNLKRINFNNSGDKQKILSIENWGTINWTSMRKAFRGCSNLNCSATDAPDLSNVTDCSQMFEDCIAFDGTIDNWDVSNVKNMKKMFYNASAFNQDIGAWDVSNVTNTHGMFQNASTFNQDISTWDVSKIGEMRFMFKGATAFNQPIGSWNTSFASNMGSMFDGATAFNQDISSWNTSRVRWMGYMFRGAMAFNQPIGNWNTSTVIKMRSMFEGAMAFDQNLGNWDISKVADMNYMLTDAGLSVDSYNETLEGWANQAVLSNITLGAELLQYCEGENARHKLINTYNWTFSGDSRASSCPFVSTWKTDNPGSSNYNQVTIPVVGSYTIYWEEVGNPQNNGTETAADTYTITFPHAGTYEIKLSGILAYIRFDNGGDKEKLLSIDYWGTNTWYDMHSAFEGCYNLSYTATDAPDLSQVSTCRSIFMYCFNFDGDIGHWDVSNVRDMRELFFDASVFNGDISSWDVSNATDMEAMFQRAYLFNQDISTWDMSRVRETQFMFLDAHNFNQDIGNWNTSEVVNMRFMFYGATSFNQDISGWDISNVDNLGYMFKNATSFNQDLSSWDVGNVKNMRFMFENATSFDQNLGNWNIATVANMANMLNHSGLSIANYDSSLIGWAAQSVLPNVSLGADGLEYCNGAAARNTLINTHNWTISNDALNCPSSSASIQINVQPKQANDQLSAYPNPAGDYLTITHPQAEQIHFQIFHANGQAVQQKWRITPRSDQMKIVDVSALSSGLYFIRSDKGMVTTFVKMQ